MDIHSYRENKYSDYACEVCNCSFTYEKIFESTYLLCYCSVATDEFIVMLDLLKKTTTIKTQAKFFDDIVLNECVVKKWLVIDKEINKLAQVYSIFS
jgi:hypothetical protein